MKELRIGLVLYGGVSLAVYMNGVVTEIWQALRASQDRYSRSREVSGTAAAYCNLMDKLKQMQGAHDLRIVVDTIAGTSAGGVNGAVLGKAIASGADGRILNKIWVERAGIEELAAPPPKRTPLWLRPIIFLVSNFVDILKRVRQLLDQTPGIDWAWVRDHVYSIFVSKDPEKTPLRGDYFTEMIASTFKAMTVGHRGPKLLPPGGQLDLILTRTDLYGWPRHLPVDADLHDDLVESAHAHRMLFRYRRPLDPKATGGLNDFKDGFSLTYASRTTAGFPLAFAPTSFQTASSSYRRAGEAKNIPDRDAFAARHMREHWLNSYSVDTAWMADGGILDNKPFSALTELIEQKPANRAVHRVLMYIEPDPSLALNAPPSNMPDPSKILGLLYKLFHHEPIYADLRAVDARNRLVDRLLLTAEAAEIDAARIMKQYIDSAPHDEEGLDTLREIATTQLRTNNNPAYPGYVMLKAKRASDSIAQFISDALGYPYESKHGYFVREIVRAWLRKQGALETPSYNQNNNQYESNASQVSLLDTFDVLYRLRRLRNMVRAANNFYDDGVDLPGETDTIAILNAFKADLMRAILDFDQLAEWVNKQGEWIRAYIQRQLKTDDLDQFIRVCKDRPSDMAGNLELHSLYRKLEVRFQKTTLDQGVRVRKVVAELPNALRERIARAYVLYPMIDAAIFPQMDAARIGDLTKMRVVRISPHDAKAMSSDPWRLKSRAIGAFAGFLRKSARKHDLLWGRLDGAERLIDQIIAASLGGKRNASVPALRAKALTEAFEAILKEAELDADAKLRELLMLLREKLPISS